jgi:hypothetical protein
MEPGGIDLSFDGKVTPEAMTAITEHLLKTWPDAVFEADTSPPRSLRGAVLTIPGTAFVYVNGQKRRVWDEHGYIDAAHGTMILICSDDTGMTITFDEPLRSLVKTLLDVTRTHSSEANPEVPRKR